MKIAATSKTPYIFFDTENARLEIKGVSCPENPKDFYMPLIDKMKEYVATQNELTLIVQLDYFNTGSSKTLWMLLDVLAQSEPIKATAKVLWITDEDDDELKEAGAIFEEMSGLQFEYVNNHENA